MGQLIILKDVPGGPVVKSTPAKEKKKKSLPTVQEHGFNPWSGN